MITRMILLGALAACCLTPAHSGEKKGFKDKELARKDDVKGGAATHVGAFMQATGDRFIIEVGAKKQTHILASDAKVLGADGREFSLGELRKGQIVRVTTRDPDPMTAHLVEVLKTPTKEKAPDK